MKLWSDLTSNVECESPVAGRTTFRAGGVARFFCCPGSVRDLATIMRRCTENGIRVKFLGGGSNVIITSDRVDAMVVWIHAPFMTSLDFKGEEVVAGAGISMQNLVSECARRALSGIEFMVGVCGTVGGAVGSDASTRNGRFLDAVREVEAVGPDGTLEGCPAEEIPNRDRAVVNCRLRLERGNPAEIRERIEAAADYRRRTQPQGVFSAGCVFRNPPGDSAGRLIEEAGLKGLSVGGAEVSAVHANFIVNAASARGPDVLDLIDRVREAVMSRFGIMLELEADIW